MTHLRSTDIFNISVLLNPWKSCDIFACL